MNKPGRNDLCPCGSGKKFKKCCDMKQKSKKINAQLLSMDPSRNLSSLFQTKVIPPVKKTEVTSEEDEPKNIIM